MSLGYDRNLYMLAFDHRASFQKGYPLKSWVGGETDAESAARTIAGNYGRVAEAYEAAAAAAGASR
jgi:hypothetical protein